MSADGRGMRGGMNVLCRIGGAPPSRLVTVLPSPSPEESDRVLAVVGAAIDSVCFRLLLALTK
jgi:hypothetical protein